MVCEVLLGLLERDRQDRADQGPAGRALQGFAIQGTEGYICSSMMCCEEYSSLQGTSRAGESGERMGERRRGQMGLGYLACKR